MKKLFVLLVIAIAVTFTSCGGNGTKKDIKADTTKTTVKVDSTKKVDTTKKADSYKFQ